MNTMQWLESGPGASLAKRREVLGLTPEEAAAQLKVKPKVIRQLEQQSWDPKTAATFIRGYLRNYARLLKVDEQEVLSQFEPLLGQLPHQSSMQSFSRKTTRDAAESRFMLATYFLLVLLIGLFLVWFWQTHMLDAEPVSVLPELEQQQPVPADTPAIRLESAQQPASDLSATELPVQQLSGQTGDGALPQEHSATAVDRGQVAASDLAAASAPQPSASQTLPESAATQLPAAPSVTEAQSAAATPLTSMQTASPTTVPALPAGNGLQIPADETASSTGGTTEHQAGTVQLQLSFSASCWVAVIDAEQQRLFYNMRSAGQQLTLTGKAPLQLTLGDPTAVQGQVNGKALDLSAFKQGQVARLTITGSQ